MISRILFALSACVAITACGETSDERSPEEHAAIVERAAELRPSSYFIAETYDRSCRLCHGVEGSGAPLTGDVEAWAPRLEQGSRVMMEHTIRGYNGMPPLGMCPDCDQQEFRALIDFMSTGESQ